MYTEAKLALHIRNDYVDYLARKMVEKTGETITIAIGKALSERLERLDVADHNNEDAVVRDLLAIASRASGKLRKERKTGRQLVDELYDEQGLPRP